MPGWQAKDSRALIYEPPFTGVELPPSAVNDTMRRLASVPIIFAKLDTPNAKPAVALTFCPSLDDEMVNGPEQSIVRRIK